MALDAAAADGSPTDEAQALRPMREFRLAPASDLDLLDLPRPPSPAADVPVQPPSEPFGKLPFFREFAGMLERNPVPPEDRGLLGRWSALAFARQVRQATLAAPVRREINAAMFGG